MQPPNAVRIDPGYFCFFNQAAVLYYARERYYRHVQTSVLEVLKKYGSDPVLLFWKAYGIIMEGTVDLKEIIL